MKAGIQSYICQSEQLWLIANDCWLYIERNPDKRRNRRDVIARNYFKYSMFLRFPKKIWINSVFSIRIDRVDGCLFFEHTSSVTLSKITRQDRCDRRSRYFSLPNVLHGSFAF